MSLKMRAVQPELKKLRKIRATIEKALEEGDISTFKKSKEEYQKALKAFREKAKPFDEKIRPLSKQIKYLDVLIMNNPIIKPNLRPISDINEVPEDFRVPQGGK